MLASSAAHACQVTNGQGGYIIGGKTDYYTEDSKTYLRTKRWGVETPNSGLIAQGHSIDGTGASYTYLYFTKDPGAAGAYVIIGGAQQYWPLYNTSRIAEDFIWGDSRGITIDSGIDTVAYWPEWGWGGSRVIFYAKPAAPDPCAGSSVWAAMAQSRDLQSKASGWANDFSWGSPLPYMDILWVGTGESWSYQYGWGQSLYGIEFGQ
jgi:hypothetical protein